MNKRNVMIGIVAILVIVLIAVLVYVFMFKDKAPSNIDMTLLNNNLEQTGGFSEMAMQDITEDVLQTLYGVEDKTAVKAMIGKMPMMNVKASMYLVVEAVEGKVDYVKEKLDKWAKNYETQWSTYLPDQYELVKSRQFGNKGNYVYLIIAENAEELKNLIK